MSGFIKFPCSKCGRPMLPGNGKRVGDQLICVPCSNTVGIDIRNQVIDAIGAVLLAKGYNLRDTNS